MRHKLISLLLVGAASISCAFAAPPPHTLAPAPHGEAAASLMQWQAMADYQAQRLAPSLRSTAQPWSLRSDGPSAFANSYARLLQSALRAQGVTLVHENTPDAARLEVAVDLARFARDYSPGRLTALTAGLWAVHGLATVIEPAGTATAMALGIDALWSLDGEDEVELAVTLTGHANGIILASQSDVFLVHAHDSRLYESGARRLPLVGR